MLLTVSFFVIFALEKTSGKGLKTYGKLVAAILIIVAVIVFLKGMSIMVTGEYPSLLKMCPMGPMPMAR